MRNGLIITLGLMLFFTGIMLLLSFIYMPSPLVSFLTLTGVAGVFLIAVGLTVTYMGIYRYIYSEADNEWREASGIPQWVEVSEEKQKKDEAMAVKKIEPFVYRGYTLYKRMVKLLSGKWQTIYFFSKRLPKSGEPTTLPHGYRVGVNERSGMPFLIKIR